MKRVIYLLLVLTYSISVYSQDKDSIIYIFSDKVETIEGVEKRANVKKIEKNKKSYL